MNRASSRIEEIMLRMPSDIRVVAETIRICATAEFGRHWPEAADDMAAVVCGRWLHATQATSGSAATSSTSSIDRLVNESFAALDDEQIAATERLFDELSGCWQER